MNPAEFAIRVHRLGFKRTTFVQYIGAEHFVDDERAKYAATVGQSRVDVARRKVARAMSGQTRDDNGNPVVTADLIAALERCERELDTLADEFETLAKDGKPIPVPNVNWGDDSPALRGIAAPIWVTAAGMIWAEYPNATFELMPSRYA